MASDLPSWLQAPPPSEPFQALLAGVRAGTGIASNILQGQRQAEQAREFQTQFEAQQVLRSQQEQLNKLHIENMIRDNQEKIDSEGAYQKVASLYSRHQALEIAGTPGSEAAIGNVIANNPSFFVHPGSKSLMADMAFSNRVRTVAEQREADAASRLEQDQARAAAALERTQTVVGGREQVAQTQAEARLEAAFIKAEASAKSQLNTKEFQTFMLRKESIKNDPTLSLDKKFEAAAKLESDYGIVRKTDAGIAAPVAGNVSSPAAAQPSAVPTASDPIPRTQEEFDALPSGTWFINPANGERRRKK